MVAPSRRVRTRSTPSPAPAPKRVCRVRANPPELPTLLRRRASPRYKVGDIGGETNPRPYFDIDWSKSLKYKLQIYLVTSYLYYQLCRSMVTDHDFDRLCRELAEGWDDFDHQHKYCTDKESMVAGTGYACAYPSMVIGAANHMLRAYSER